MECAVRSAAHFKCTTGSTEIPSGSGCAESSPLSMTIFTGTRCTILTKFPVAFSAGNAEKREPGTKLHAVHVPHQAQPGKRIHPDIDALTRPHTGELVFFEIRGHPNLRRDQRHHRLSHLHVVALVDVALGDPAVLRRAHFRPAQVQFRLRELRLRQFDLGLN